MKCPHGIELKFNRCEQCEQIADNELVGFADTKSPVFDGPHGRECLPDPIIRKAKLKLNTEGDE